VERPFNDASTRPVETAIAATLGSAHSRFKIVEELADGFMADWNFVKGSGWMLKIHAKRKALLYLVPLQGAFRISMAIREAERDLLLQDPDLAPLHEMLASAKKYPEGFYLQLDVNDEMDFGPVESLVIKLIAART
jgi:hypothetical protein